MNTIPHIRRSFHMKKTKVQRLIPSVVLFLLPFLPEIAIVSAQTPQKYELAYKYKKGDVRHYKTEKHDSTTSLVGTQTMNMKMTSWTLQTMTITDVKSGTYSLTVKIDSAWSDRSGPQGGPGGNVTVIRSEGGTGREGGTREGGRTGGGREFGGPPSGNRGGESRGMRWPRESSYTMSSRGISTSKDPVTAAFIIPLPAQSVTVNEVWDFTYTTQIKERGTGTNEVKGQCTLYDVQNQGNARIARIIVNFETIRDMTFSFTTEQGTITGSNKGKSTGFSLVYFDIDKGIVTEVVTEENGTSSNETPMGAMETASSSKTEVTLTQ